MQCPLKFSFTWLIAWPNDFLSIFLNFSQQISSFFDCFE